MWSCSSNGVRIDAVAQGESDWYWFALLFMVFFIVMAVSIFMVSH